MRPTEPADDALAAAPSPRVVQVAAMFGLGVDQDQSHIIIPPTDLSLREHDLVFITGASGGGKSTLLRLIAEQLQDNDQVALIEFDALEAPSDLPIVDAVDAGQLSLDRVLRLLSLSGLNDAFVMLRKPSELSDGQRYRFRLAQTMARVEANPRPCTVVVADEFGATLDRVTASVLARNVRRWVNQTPGVVFLAATTHDDLLEPFEPDVLIEKQLGEHIHVLRRS